MLIPFYDPEKSYEENFQEGPFGVFKDGEVFKNESEPQYDFLGQKVFSPFGIPAGPLLNGNFCKRALDKGFDIVTYKTVRSSKYPSHPWPNVLAVKINGNLTIKKTQGSLIIEENYHTPLSITNSFGVPSREPEFWQKDLNEVIKYARPGQVVIGSFQGSKKEKQSAEEYINDFRITAKMLKDTGVKIIEVNLSCPNEGTNSLLYYNTERSVKVIQVIKKAIGDIPLIVKIGYFENKKMLQNFVKKIGNMVQGISAINTILVEEIVDKKGNQALPGEGRLRSGICGHAVKWAGLEMVKRLEKLRQEFNYSYIIIGVGGVSSVEDFLEYKNAGADVVMSATGAMWNPYLARDIKNKL